MNQETSASTKTWLLASGLILIALGFAVYMAYQRLHTVYTPVPVPIPLVRSTNATSAAIPSPIPANWKIYDTLDFSFRYPPNLEVFESTKDFFTILNSGISIDARTWQDTDFDQAVTKIEKNLATFTQEPTRNGFKINGTQIIANKGINSIIIVIHYKTGAMEIKYEGSLLNMAVFNQVVDSLSLKNNN